MISINISELIWTVINFFLLLFLLNRFLYKPVIDFMSRRQARIDAGLQEEEEARAAVGKNDEQLRAEKARAQEEAKALLAQNAEKIDKHSAEALQEAKKACQQDRKDMEAALADKQRQTGEELRDAAPELAAILTERLLDGE